MAALSKIHIAPPVRSSAAKRVMTRLAIECSELAARVGGAVAEILVFVWTILVLGFFGLLAAAFLLA